jgi:hypothetical protein
LEQPAVDRSARWTNHDRLRSLPHCPRRPGRFGRRPHLYRRTRAGLGLYLLGGRPPSRAPSIRSSVAGVPRLSEKRNPDMQTRAVMVTVGRTAVAVAAAVLWTAPLASAGSDFCNSLPPAQIRDCTCGSDNVPGTPEFQDCLHGNAAPKAPPADAPAPSP